MAAYVIADIEVTDLERYEGYKRLAGPAIEACGGKYLVRGGKTDVLEGKWQPNRLVVLEFESVEQAHAWWNSTYYADAKAIRQGSANSNMVVVAGV